MDCSAHKRINCKLSIILTYQQQLDKPLFWKAIHVDITLNTPSLATCIAINHPFSLIAIGTSAGEVLVYSMNSGAKQSSLLISFSHAMILSRPDETPARASSAATSLTWSADGYALAAGWIVGGMAVWSVYGHLMASTFADDPYYFTSTYIFCISKLTLDRTQEELRDDFFLGVQDLVISQHKGSSKKAWGPGSYDLLLLPASQYENGISLWHSYSTQQTTSETFTRCSLPNQACPCASTL